MFVLLMSTVGQGAYRDLEGLQVGVSCRLVVRTHGELAPFPTNSATDTILTEGPA
jgi:hypothetical protein